MKGKGSGSKKKKNCEIHLEGEKKQLVFFLNSERLKGVDVQSDLSVLEMNCQC